MGPLHYAKVVMRTMRAMEALRLAALLAIATFAASCTDPVRDAAIERLGGEAGGVSEGPEHRPGQPCVLCHSEGGPASSAPFAIAGTIFETKDPRSKGAENVNVFFIDASSAQRTYTTNAAGNFYIPESEWADLTFPFKVGIVKNGKIVEMRTTVNREGSCNFCHKPNPGSPYSLKGDDTRESVGQVYVTAGAP